MQGARTAYLVAASARIYLLYSKNMRRKNTGTSLNNDIFWPHPSIAASKKCTSRRVQVAPKGLRMDATTPSKLLINMRNAPPAKSALKMRG